jgi:hypothetical protein
MFFRMALSIRLNAGDSTPVAVIEFVDRDVDAKGAADRARALEDSQGRFRTLADAMPLVDRLAPEHPFPAPLDDVLAALRFVERGGLGVRRRSIRSAVGGQSGREATGAPRPRAGGATEDPSARRDRS